MNIEIIEAIMNHSKEEGYVGQVAFQVDQKQQYEITLYSKNGKEWGYGLHFLNNSGHERDIELVEEYIEENDDYFDQLVNAAMESLNK